MRHGRLVLAVTVSILAVLSGHNRMRAEPSSLPPRMLDDAELTDVFFLDAEHGWAVGEQGVIWLTEDGGRHWQLADSPVNCRLESICFVDRQHGWAAGGWSHPYSHRTSAVLLRTDNGGRRWTRISVETLPKLLELKFFDTRRGWAVGSPSGLYPSGVFHTSDGGRSWSSLPTSSQHAWLAADFWSKDQGLIVGRDGIAATSDQRQLQLLSPSPTGLRQPRVAHVANQNQYWIAGDGGYLASSKDHGRNWRLAALPVSPDLAGNIDFRAIAVQGATCWAAGSPGSCLFRSTDQGATWHLLHTGQRLPINAMAFLNEQQGWTVGPLGTILNTRDGGQSWHKQRSGGSRAGVLGLFAEAKDVPLELFTQLSGDEGYLGVVEVLTRRDVEGHAVGEMNADGRVREAVVATGGSHANQSWRFPLRQAGLRMTPASIVQGWSVANGRDGLQALEEHVVLKLRQWQPEIVVGGASDDPHGDSLAHVIHQVALSALERAADPRAYPEQIDGLGLTPWRAKKLFVATGPDRSSSVVLETSRLATQLGRSLREHAALSRGLLHQHWTPSAEQLHFDLLWSSIPRLPAGQDLFAGLTIPHGSDCRRRSGSPPPTPLARLGRQAHKQRALEALLKRATEETHDAASWLAQVDDLTRDMSVLSAGESLFQLGQHYREVGAYDLSAQTLEALRDGYPDHPLAEAAITWLVQYHASAEVARVFGPKEIDRRRRDDAVALAASFNSALPPGVGRELQVTHFDSSDQTATLQSDAIEAGKTTSAQLAALLHNIDPALASEPQLRAALASVARRQGQRLESRRQFQHMATSQPMGPWQQTARAEAWLDDRRGHSPKPLLRCAATMAKPRLDGILNEELWQAAAPAELSSQLGEDQAWPAAVWLARDDEYLYVAAQCGKADAFEYGSQSDSRPRDPDLRTQDRIELLLDVDRDYNTFFRLTVDHRGWTGESCWGNPAWNPQWFVAASSDAHSWTIEAAIPLGELTEIERRGGQIWAVGLQRVVPGVGFQSWTRPASVQGRPEGFGLLLLDSESASGFSPRPILQSDELREATSSLTP